MNYAELLSPEFRARLAHLQVAARRALPSSMRGDRRAPLRKGISLEFADFRNYVPGDDVRHLDWSAYARLDQLVLKLCHDEEDLQVHLLVDDSASMKHGAPQKALAARRIGAALGWLSLRAGARVSAALLGESFERLPLVRGESGTERLLTFLSADCTASQKPLHRCCEEYAALARPFGIVVLISDLFDPAGPVAAVRALHRRTTEVNVLHVLSKDDTDPDLEGELRLIDAEGAPSVETTVSPARLAAYRAVVRAFIAECADLCLRRGAGYVFAAGDRALEGLFLDDMVRAGMVR